MGLLLAAAVGAVVTPPVDPLASNPTAAPPYTIPTAAPFETPSALSIPTYDGAHQTVHPSVVDFGPGVTWNGWRYWMAHTPYAGANDRLENPSISVSQNGYYWQDPPGIVNPLYPAPAAPGFQSDPDLIYDPVANQLIMVHRRTLDTVGHTLFINRSSDGIHWTLPAHDSGIPTVPQQVSPALCRVSATDWRLFAYDKDSRRIWMWTATNPDGTWKGPYQTVGAGFSGPLWAWHLEVRYIDGLFYALIDRGPLYLGGPDGYRWATSRDGMTWSLAAADFKAKPATGWDAGELYRATFTAHENGTDFRVWYSAHSDATPQVWGVGLIHTPRSITPTPPAAVTAGTGTTYRDVALTDTPSVLWRMGVDPLSVTPPTAATEPDATGQARAGTYVGGFSQVTSPSGDTGYATRYDVGCTWRGYDSWMGALTAHSVRAVITPHVLYSAQTIAAVWGADGGWALKTSGTYLQYVHSSGVTVTASSPMSTGTTYHVGVTVDAAGTVRLYRNGVEVGSGTVTLAAATSNARLSVGARWTGTAWAENLSATIEYVDVTPAALTAARMTASAAAV